MDGLSHQPQDVRMSQPAALYSPAERDRRDRSGWTMVQAVLAPIQFVAFLLSLLLVVRALATGDGTTAAIVSVVAKTAILYAIMLTGSIWEKQVFGRWLFAPAFLWEDVVSLVVLALHTAYLWALATDALSSRHLLVLALAAYATYCVNAAQYVSKFRLARLQPTTVAA